MSSTEPARNSGSCVTRSPPITDRCCSSGSRATIACVAVSPIHVSYADIATGNMLASNLLLTQWSSLVTVPDGLMTVDSAGALLRWRLDPEFLLAKLCPELKTERSVARVADLPRWRNRVDDVPGGVLMFDVFISYAHEDEGLASALASGLGRIGKPWWRRRSLRVFRDANVMTASADLWDSIRRPLEESRWFVAVISPAAAASPWVSREIAVVGGQPRHDHLLGRVRRRHVYVGRPRPTIGRRTRPRFRHRCGARSTVSRRWVDATWTARSSAARPP